MPVKDYQSKVFESESRQRSKRVRR